MTDTQGTLSGPAPRWPGVIGTIGIILGVIMFIDKADDLFVLRLMRSQETWRQFVGTELAKFIVDAMPARFWMLSSSLIGLALAVLLVVGSSRLVRRRQSGITLCKTWSWLAIAWVLIEIAQVSWWFNVYGSRIPGVAGTAWRAPTISVLIVVFLVMLAYPIFQLLWFSRGDVREQIQLWPP
ncbi:MAG: hypothetical protein JSV80_15705 [Acidobacteriota bacterium]|nr:MAG: hypothetical protein JSV80_15705 [Acidobacteriota bacterium]